MGNMEKQKIKELAAEVSEKVLSGMDLNAAIKQAHRKMGFKNGNKGK